MCPLFVVFLLQVKELSKAKREFEAQVLALTQYQWQHQHAIEIAHQTPPDTPNIPSPTTSSSQPDTPRSHHHGLDLNVIKEEEEGENEEESRPALQYEYRNDGGGTFLLEEMGWAAGMEGAKDMLIQRLSRQLAEAQEREC